MVTVFDPQGNRGEIPEANLAAFVKAGGMPGVTVKAPDGTLGHVPANRMHEALAVPGAKLVPFEQQDVKHPGFWSMLVDDIKAMPGNTYHAAADYDPMTDPNLSEAEKMKIADQQSAATQATNAAREKAHGKAYSLGSSAKEMVGINVAGEEKSAEEGDFWGVLGHTFAVPAVMAASEVARPFATRLAGALSDTPAAVAERLRNATPKQAAQVAGAATGAGLGHGTLSVPGAYYGAKGAGAMVESIIGKERANAPIFPGARPVYPGAPFPERPGVFPGAPLPANPLPEQINPALVSPARTLPGMNPPEVIRPPAQPIPARPGLQLTGEVQIPERYAPPSETAAAEAIPQPMRVTPAGETIPRTLPPKFATVTDLAQQINDALGGKPLKPGVPLRDQMKPSVVAAAKLPEGFTAVDSSALKGYKYDPAAREFESITQDGQRYIHGDVSPEDAKAFAEADSKGKAWQQIRQNPLVAKVVNGKRVSVRPVRSVTADPAETKAPPESATPAKPQAANDDLTAILEESLKRAQAQRARQ